MTNSKFLCVNFNNKEYKINKDKLIEILSILISNKETINANDENLNNLIIKYSLLDEVFLKEISE